MIMAICKNCSTVLSKHGKKYCSIACQKDAQYNDYVTRWKSGRATGERGKRTFNFSRHIVRYLFDKYNNACATCGWCEINERTGVPPLEIDHINGNSKDNSENNLILLCPNCHSLTSTYRNLNHGNGRAWRRGRLYDTIENTPL